MRQVEPAKWLRYISGWRFLDGYNVGASRKVNDGRHWAVERKLMLGQHSEERGDEEIKILQFDSPTTLGQIESRSILMVAEKHGQRLDLTTGRRRSLDPFASGSEPW